MKPLPKPAMLYLRNAVVRAVTDGDTVALDVDMGFNVWARLALRLMRIDAPERWDTVPAAAAKANLVGLLPPGSVLLVQSVNMTDKYGGRFDGHAWLPDGRDVAALQVAAGVAREWVSGAAKPFPLKKPGEGNG